MIWIEKKSFSTPGMPLEMRVLGGSIVLSDHRQEIFHFSEICLLLMHLTFKQEVPNDYGQDNDECTSGKATGGRADTYFYD